MINIIKSPVAEKQTHSTGKASYCMVIIEHIVSIN